MQKVAGKEINDVKDPGIVKKRVAQNWFRPFKEVATRLEDKLRSERPSVVEDEALLEMVEQPSTSTSTCSAELGPSQSTINQHFH